MKPADWTELTLTKRCNQRCFFCYEAARDVAKDPPLSRIKELLEQTRQHADQVSLCGKEIALRPDLLKIVAHGASLGLRVVLFSNGQAFARRDLINRLADAGCAGLALSFHFPDEEAFVRGARVRREGFQRTLEGLRHIGAFIALRRGGGLGVSTETDLCALNAGRLADMRRTLCETLGEGGWQMRLASLLPCDTYDIGLDHAFDSLACRRGEVADFVRTQPRGIALGFVKLPLCLLPSEVLHQSLDLQYVHAGTVLTFNHADADRVTIDTISSSAAREVEKELRAHPYRWICRGCNFVSLCRFARVSWSYPIFRPTREQRPTPISGVAPKEVLARLAPVNGSGRRIAAVGRRLKALRFPEDDLLGALRSTKRGAPRLLEAWVENKPVLAASFRFRGRATALQLAAPRFENTPVKLGLVIGWLHARPLGRGARGVDAAALLRALPLSALPAAAGWSGEPWFDEQAAFTLRSAWDLLGERLWPGGAIAGWKTVSAALLPAKRLQVALRGPGGRCARLSYAPEGWELDAGADSHALRSEFEKIFGRPATFPIGTPASPEMLVFRAEAGGSSYSFHIANFREGQPQMLRRGRLMLWCGQSAMGAEAAAVAPALALVMRSFQKLPTSDAALETWRRGLTLVLERLGLPSFRWTLGLEGAPQ